MNKQDILNKLKQLKLLYKKEGVEIIGLFGSYARDAQNEFSDIDIAYKIDHSKFSQFYKDGFSKILRLDDIKAELQENLHAKVDFIPNSNKKILEGIINV